jgi:integrase
VLAGPRIGEALGLHWRDVNLGDEPHDGNVIPLPVKGRASIGTIRIRGSKTSNADRRVQLSPALRRELAALREAIGSPAPDRRVFATGKGGRFSESNIRNRILAPAIKIANETLVAAGHEQIMDGITPHSLRRTFASMLAKRGEDPATMMGQMGHSTAELTFEVYAKAGDADREAWEALWQGRNGQEMGNSTSEGHGDEGQQEAV